MFGFGREKRVRREAANLLHGYLKIELDHGALTDKVSVTNPVQLADELMRKVATSSLGSFAGERLSNLSPVGLAMEGLCYGVLDLGNRPADQIFAFNAYMRMLASTQIGHLPLASADHDMVALLTEQIAVHPPIIEFLASKRLSEESITVWPAKGISVPMDAELNERKMQLKARFNAIKR